MTRRSNSSNFSPNQKSFGLKGENNETSKEAERDEELRKQRAKSLDV
jgi:hypothetical protein